MTLNSKKPSLEAIKCEGIHEWFDINLTTNNTNIGIWNWIAIRFDWALFVYYSLVLSESKNDDVFINYSYSPFICIVIRRIN